MYTFRTIFALPLLGLALAFIAISDGFEFAARKFYNVAHRLRGPAPKV